MRRLDLLKKELKIIKELDCLALNIKEQAEEYYNHEIECIEKYGSPNPDYVERPLRKFINIVIKE